MYDLIIVGGGIIGCSVAEWSGAGFARICVVEQDPNTVTEGTSAAAAGGVTPFLGDHWAGGLGAMAARSRDLYRGWVKRVGAKAGRPLHVRHTGLLQLAIDDVETDRLQNKVLPHLDACGVDATMLTGDEARRREPLLGPEVRAALEQPADLAVEPMRIMDALHRALRADDRVEIVYARTAAVAAAGGRVEVVLADGRTLHGERAVVAAGHRSGGLLERHGVPAQVFQAVKGQILDMRVPRGGAPRYLSDMVTHESGDERVVFVTPYRGDRLAAGATFERHETDPRPVLTKARDLILPNLRRALPRVADYEIVGSRAGMRPRTLDDIPLVGFVDPDRRILAATGHSGLGLTLAPRTAQLVAGLLEDRAPLGADDRADLALCDPQRFAAGASA
ncbi:NAD(P)/FAD-dependent oxidoreductase [Actinomadura parmotrematis]|uniref:FAD-binding oxidoreductase n=1 Tax=Actinomadura parmotrematis TaxID=2864039 RepID=A0ABS7G4Q2_9ACTN|nr:FAD-dependent oxidoreductase [Actinomadura parmotrematis]MBW8487684.1 FAD-binding oxidoreductase [Actinomadura parmotrematis]